MTTLRQFIHQYQGALDRQCVHGQPMPGHPAFQANTPFCAACAQAGAFRLAFTALARDIGVWPDTELLPENVVSLAMGLLSSERPLTWNMLKEVMHMIGPGLLDPDEPEEP